MQPPFVVQVLSHALFAEGQNNEFPCVTHALGAKCIEILNFGFVKHALT